MDYLILSGQLMSILLAGIGSLWLIYRQDRQNHQPIKNLLHAFGLGILINISFLNIYINFDYFSIFSYYPSQSKLFLFVNAVFIFGLIEELAPFLMLWFYIRPIKKVNSALDGAFYAMAITLGFSATHSLIFLFENQIYAGQFWRNSLLDLLFSLIFASAWGYAVGVYAVEHKIKPVILTFICCFLAHGLLNFCIIINISFFWIFLILIFFIIFILHKLRLFAPENFLNAEGNQMK